MRKAPEPKKNGNSNSIILDWKIAGVRYTLSPPGKWDKPDDVSRAKRLGEGIYDDYKTGNFDRTLRKYKTPEQVQSECTPTIRFSKGFYRIYLKHQGKEIDFNAGMSEEGAKDLAKRLESDCIAGELDPTLQKYMPESVKADFETRNQRIVEQEYLKATQFRPSLELYREFCGVKQEKLQYSSFTTYRQLLHRLEALPKPVIPEKANLEERLKTSFPYDADLAEKFLKETKLSQKTQKNYSTCFTAFGKWLVKSKGYSQNPYSELEIKVTKRTKRKAFTKEECIKIISYFNQKHPLYAQYVRFRLSVGMRSGELSGLRWSDIDFENGKIEVYEQITRVEGGKLGRKDTLKNGKGREIPLNTGVLEILAIQKQVLSNKENLKDHELVFPNQYGNPIDASHFAGKYWKPALTALEIPYRPPYASRHTSGSHLLEAGMPPTQVAKILGHDVGMFFRHYQSEIDKINLPELGF